jgi:hypothetical protein
LSPFRITTLEAQPLNFTHPCLSSTRNPPLRGRAPDLTRLGSSFPQDLDYIADFLRRHKALDKWVKTLRQRSKTRRALLDACPYAWDGGHLNQHLADSQHKQVR